MIAQALREQGVEPPEDVLPAEVWPVAEPFRRAFHVLSAARGAGGMGGPVAISYEAILAYARANGLAATQADLEECVMLIQAQDLVFVKHYRPKEKP